MSVAFDVIFGVFVVAILVLAVVAVRWARGRDRIARARHQDQPVRSDLPGMVPGPAGPDRSGPLP